MKVSKIFSIKLLMTLMSVGIAIIMSALNVDAAPYQELEPRKGYVPVYIRYGDTPLSEIHPKLAEAFHEDDEQMSAAQIESASLTESKSQSSDDKKLENGNESSDIASFDKIKAMDEADKKE